MNITEIRAGIVQQICKSESEVSRLTKALAALDKGQEGTGDTSATDMNLGTEDVPAGYALYPRRTQTTEVRARIGASTRARHLRNRLAKEAAASAATPSAGAPSGQPTEPQDSPSWRPVQGFKHE